MKKCPLSNTHHRLWPQCGRLLWAFQPLRDFTNFFKLFSCDLIENYIYWSPRGDFNRWNYPVFDLRIFETVFSHPGGSVRLNAFTMQACWCSRWNIYYNHVRMLIHANKRLTHSAVISFAGVWSWKKIEIWPDDGTQRKVRSLFHSSWGEHGRLWQISSQSIKYLMRHKKLKPHGGTQWVRFFLEGTIKGSHHTEYNSACENNHRFWGRRFAK